MTEPVEAALRLWGLEGAVVSFVAGRENQVYRVSSDRGDFALRLRRPGYRSDAELASELDWLAAMAAASLRVPRPDPSLTGALLECVGETRADILRWLPGAPLGRTREPLTIADPEETFERLGSEIARLHNACDVWAPPPGFTRCAWDLDGLVGDNPVWGRFWENPSLDDTARSLFEAFRDAAARDLSARSETLDYGLIHADLVRENILIGGDDIVLIDFDDGGWGFRLFDIATVLLKTVDDTGREAQQQALMRGYQRLRSLDPSLLDLFIALRAATYVGWIVPRMSEAGAEARNRRFIEAAAAICGKYLS